MHNLYQPIAKSGTVTLRLDKPFPFICQPILIIAVSMLLYLYTIGNNFVYDDKFTIVNNYLIRSWHRAPMIFTSDYFTASGELSYRPLVTLTYFIDYTLWRLNPLGYHLTNLLLHCLNSVFLFFLLIRLFNTINGETNKEPNPVFPQNSERYTSRSLSVKTSAPFMASLIFCTHPLLAEAVNAISYREDLLASTFYFPAFLFYLMASQQKSHLWYTISLVCYFMGLFSKETTITLPALIIMYDFLCGGKTRFAYKIIRYYTGYFLMSVFYLLLRFVFFHNPVESGILYPQGSLWVNVLAMSKVLASYIKLLFFPIDLNADYVVPYTSFPTEISFILSLLLIISAMVITYRLFFCSKILFFSVLWFFIALLPVMNIIPIENIMAERYLSIPLVGFCILGGVLLHKISTIDIKKKFLRACSFTFMTSLVLTGFSWQTCHISQIWFNELSFLSTTAKKSPQSARAHNNIGVLYKKMGFIDAAVREYTAAIQIKPDYSEAHSNLANVYIDKGYFENAIAEYKISTEISPFNETAHFNLGLAYEKMGLSRNAEVEYENAIRINNNNPHAHNNLGNIYEDRNSLEKAMAEYKLSLSIDQSNAITHNNIGNVFCKKGSIDEAILEYSAAAENDPTRTIYHENLGNTYLKKGLIEEAIAEFEAIIAIDPGKSASYRNLVMLYWGHKKDREKACFYLGKLSELEPYRKEAISKMIEKLQTK